MSEKHHIFDIFEVVKRKSNNLSRRISYFRNKQSPNREVSLYVYFDKRGWWCSIEMHGNFWIGFLFKKCYLFQSGECEIFPEEEMRKGYRFSSEEIMLRSKLGDSFQTLVKWLEDPETVRINPYQPEIILTEEEEDVDRYFSSVTKALDRIGVTPLRPGIQEAGEEPPSN